MCKHVAAALYGVGARLDEKPELLFQLRAVDGNDLAASLDGALPLTKRGLAAGKVLQTEDVSALFGLDMDGGDDAADGGGPVASRTAKAEQLRAAKAGATRKPARPAAKPKARAKAAARRSSRSR